jgi:hypothetical protein
MDHLLSGWDEQRQKRRGRRNGNAFEDEWKGFWERRLLGDC